MKNNNLTHKENVRIFFKAGGDAKFLFDYPELTKDSIVFDVGGYKGEWTQVLKNKINCNYYIFEPVESFYNNIVKMYMNDKNVIVKNYGLSNNTRTAYISLDGDASSINTNSKNVLPIKLVNINDTLESIDKIDLLKLNVEGEEFNILEAMIKSNTLNKCDNILVQFHRLVDNHEERRNKIVNELSKTHKRTFNFEFVWENWKKK